MTEIKPRCARPSVYMLFDHEEKGHLEVRGRVHWPTAREARIALMRRLSHNEGVCLR